MAGCPVGQSAKEQGTDTSHEPWDKAHDDADSHVREV